MKPTSSDNIYGAFAIAPQQTSHHKPTEPTISGLETRSYCHKKLRFCFCARMGSETRRRDDLNRRTRWRPRGAPRRGTSTPTSSRGPRRRAAPWHRGSSRPQPPPWGGPSRRPARSQSLSTARTKPKFPKISAQPQNSAKGGNPDAERAVCTYSWRDGGCRRPPPGRAAAAASRDLQAGGGDGLGLITGSPRPVRRVRGG